MTRIARVLHDAWCAVTRRCGWNGVADTPLNRWLQEEERESRKSVPRIASRQRRLHVLEQAILGDRMQDGGKP